MKTKMKEIHMPKAKNIRAESSKKVIINWIDKVEAAKLDGQTSCLVVTGDGITKEVVKKFLDAGYDLYYNHFLFDGSWFVEAHWEDGCCGRIYSEKDDRYVDIETMFTY